MKWLKGLLKFIPIGSALNYGKIVLIIGLLTSLGSYHWWQVGTAYDRGVNETSLAYERLQTGVNQEAITLALQELKKSMDFKNTEAEAASKAISELEVITNKLKEMTEDDKVELEEVVKNLACTRFGDEFFRVWNKPYSETFDKQ